MNDLLIRAEKLIATMKNNKKALLWLRDYEAKAKKKPCEWISVKDRFPEISHKQLLTFDKFGNARIDELLPGKGANRAFLSEVSVRNPGIRVTHWFPLPKLPGENGESDA